MSTLSSTNFTSGNILLKECTQVMNNKIKLPVLILYYYVVHHLGAFF